MVGLAVGAERVPDRDGHAEEALAAREPVAVEAVHPVVVPDLHVRRVPVELLAPCEQRLAQLLVPPAVADEPLPAGHDLERALAALVELHGMGDGPGLADHVARGREHLDHGPLGLLHRASRDGPPRLAVGNTRRRRLGDAARAGEDVAGGQVELAPPHDVGDVAEGADHRDARPLVRLGQVVGQDRHLHPEERRVHGRPEALLVALVVGVGDQRHAGGDQLGAGGLDLDVVEAQPVVGAGPLAVLHLGLRHGGLVVDVPQRRRFGRVGLTPGQVAQEHALARPPAPVVDGGVAQLPVDREADAAPQCLEGAFVVGRQLVAQRDEVGPADRGVLGTRLLRGHEVGVVGQRRVAGHAEIGLHPAFGRQAVVVPPHGVEHLPAPHAPVAGDGVGLHVAEDRSHVQRPRHRRRGGVDGEDLVPRGTGVEPVGALLVPRGGPTLLQAVEGRLVGDPGRAGRGGRHDRVTVPGCCTFTTPPRARSAPSSSATRARSPCTCVARPSTTCPTSATGGPTSPSTSSGAT